MNHDDVVVGHLYECVGQHWVATGKDRWGVHLVRVDTCERRYAPPEYLVPAPMKYHGGAIPGWTRVSVQHGAERPDMPQWFWDETDYLIGEYLVNETKQRIIRL